MSKLACWKASFAFFAAAAALFVLCVRLSVASAASSMTAAVLGGRYSHSFPAALPPKTLAMVCATLLASVATAARTFAIVLSTGSSTVPMVRAAMPNCFLMSAMVFDSCFMRPVGVLASAWFMPPTLFSTAWASTAARSASLPNFMMFAWASSKLIPYRFSTATFPFITLPNMVAMVAACSELTFKPNCCAARSFMAGISFSSDAASSR